MISRATHRFDLWPAKFFFSWAVARGYLGADPFKDVKPVGKVRAGEQQLRIEEARRFTETALVYFQERNRPLAIGALLALMRGLRTSEVMNCVVRDLDDGAHYLWIDEGQTENARRHLEVPDVLRPLSRLVLYNWTRSLGDIFFAKLGVGAAWGTFPCPPSGKAGRLPPPCASRAGGAPLRSGRIAALRDDPGQRLLLGLAEGQRGKAARHYADSTQHQCEHRAYRQRAAVADVATHWMDACPLGAEVPGLCRHRGELADVGEREVVPILDDDSLGQLQYGLEILK